jgi:signal transduction histidine kinase
VLAPLLAGERLIGVLALDRGTADGAGTADERVLARAVARMVAMVLERERLLAEREAARAEELALREANRLMDDFLSIASHELKTPIIGADLNIQAVAHKLKRLRAATEDRALQPQTEHVLALAERTKRQIRRLSRLVEDLLDTTRIKRGEIKVRRVPTALVPIVENALADERAAYPQRVITLAVLTDAALPLVADPDRIGQVVTNYLNNALSYSPEDRPISVLVTREMGVARVSVRDEGQGIAHDELPRIWGRFQRAAGVARQTEAGIGFGLGLYISRAIIEHHGGTVGVQSAPDQGATFWFTLPLT